MKSSDQNSLVRELVAIVRMMTVVVSLLLIGTVATLFYGLSGRNKAEVSATPPESITTSTLSSSPTDTPIPIYSGDGLQEGEGLRIVKANCLGCHSEKLITQNRFTREGWHEKIVWMQQTQGLWDLGDNEPLILDYLAEHYAPQARASRRPPLTDIEWYKLTDNEDSRLTK